MTPLSPRRVQQGPSPSGLRTALVVGLCAWLGPGLLDWWCHRKTAIEHPRNGAVTESLLHAAMLAEGGIPLVLGTFFEVNPPVAILMAGSALVHEATAVADVRVAKNSQRELTQTEQHIHSFLEVMPFGMSALLLLRQPRSSGWALHKREPVCSKRALVIAAAAIAVMGVVPYGEEFARCVRTARKEPPCASAES
jgi:hypothetical protein